MSERTTGATPEQIERAHQSNESDNGFACRCQACTQLVHKWARFFVHPDERIVDVADLRALLHYGEPGLYGEDSDTLDRITALIGGEA